MINMKCWLRISVERGQECITGCFETQSEAHKAGCEIWNHDRLVTNVWVAKTARLRLLFQSESILSVEKPWEEKSTEPTQLLLWHGDEHDRAEGHRPAPRWSDCDPEPRSRPGLTLGCSDERVPSSRIGREVGQNGPHPRRGCMDVDGRFN